MAGGKSFGAADERGSLHCFNPRSSVFIGG
jgi:hypothetical protein